MTLEKVYCTKCKKETKRWNATVFKYGSPYNERVSKCCYEPYVKESEAFEKIGDAHLQEILI